MRDPICALTLVWFRAYIWPKVSVSSGCYNKIPQAGWLKNRHFLFTVLENRNPRSVDPPWWSSGWESACQCRAYRLALVQEVPTSHRETKSMHHNYQACAPETTNHFSSCSWAPALRPQKPTRLQLAPCNTRSHCKEKPEHRNEE